MKVRFIYLTNCWFTIIIIQVLALIISSLILIHNNTTNTVNSECSQVATDMGLFQKVVSYSLYLKDEKEFRARYLPGIVGNYEAIQKFYPGWLMRVYTDVEDISTLLPHPIVKYTNLFICNVNNLPILGNVSQMNKMMWRFLAVGDTTVSTLLVRDLDSIITSRELAAVSEWENSTKIFHGMRDHVGHTAPVLGGLWGAKNHLMSQSMRQDLKNIFIQRGMQEKAYGEDQTILREELYSKYKASFLIHDSYHCRYYRDSIPFPTQRQHLSDFVGAHHFGAPFHSFAAECPVKCRPTFGKNWTYC